MGALGILGIQSFILLTMRKFKAPMDGKYEVFENMKYAGD